VNRAVTAAALGCAAGLTALLTGCGGESTAGEPVATDPPPSTESSTDDPPAPESSESDYSLAQLCGLLTAEEARQFGGSPDGTEGNSTKDGHEQCRWDDETSLVIGVQPGGKSANAPTGPGITNTPVDVDGLTGVQSLATDPILMCQLLVDLPSGNLISVGAAPLSAGEGKYEPCDVANQMADLVVPRVKDD
jgi:hypothetical protein